MSAGDTQTVLDRILAHKRGELAARTELRSKDQLREAAQSAPPTRGFVEAIQARIEAGGAAVIAEVKKASPSKGVIREDFDPEAIARAVSTQIKKDSEAADLRREEATAKREAAFLERAGAVFLNNEARAFV